MRRDAIKVTIKSLNALKPRYLKKNFPVPKWIMFSETMLKAGWNVQVYSATSTFSKYVYVKHKGEQFKIRFSNHKPNQDAEDAEDCDYYVGVSNKSVLRTEKLLEILLKKNENNIQKKR